MESDSGSYYEENSEAEEEVAGALKREINVNLEESPESPPPGCPSPVLPQLIPLGELSAVWELPYHGTNFLNCYARADILELKNWA